ncbi:conserved hypothetical protein [Histoplasma capsulatum G186AR]|uniref:Uncharacterized protein n=1 Tax=Ajellomyces capsulatus (strain G186AR / H82 / ATCC MYA-2454 / RMSCC 2432) TaxID=447093 RepID=C0NSL9_AJECG|nr:uncharacterized protein HCBG_06149 [Histoplasma capsulatum G186AR]EEH05885.1 conserved hypothetical protein [Histoplasma capsulatum G186AR]
MPASSIQMQRLMSIVGATCVALACGTNYVYSAWAPQFAARLKLSSTDSNLIGAAGNLGMYASGIPVGLLIDSKGPRPGMLLGIVALGAGYFPMHRAYVSGKGSFGVPALCFFMLLTGVGSSCGFSGAIKTAASNFPDHRGTSTSFPLAAFGLSAFFFSTLSAFAFSDNTGQFLLLLAICTPAILFVCSIFVRLIPHSAPYTPLPSDTNLHPSSSQLHIPGSRGSRCRDSTEIGMPHETSNSTTLEDAASGSAGCSKPVAPKLDQPETSSLIGRHLSPRTSEDSFRDEDASVSPGRDSLYADVRGWSMIPTVEFWQLFVLLGLFTGIGLMTIKTGIEANVTKQYWEQRKAPFSPPNLKAKALWKHYDDSADSEFIQKQQMMHWLRYPSKKPPYVAILLAGFMISDPHLLVALSGLTGLAYGFLFGVFPSLVTHTFGVGGISQNWGVMCMSPVIWGNIFNLLYGRIYDSHSVESPNGELDCSEGLKCYRTSYIITFYAGIAGIAITLWTIWHEKKVFNRLHRKGFRD